MTHKSIVVALTVLALAGCEKDRDKAGSTTTTGAGTGDQPATAEEVRTALVATRPDQTKAINALQITNVDGLVTLHGNVDDEEAKKAIDERAKRMRGVTGVKDELIVVPTKPKIEDPSQGTGAPGGSQP